MNRRLLAALGAACLILASVATPSVTGAGPHRAGSRTIERQPGAGTKIDPKLLAQLAGKDKQVNVVLELAAKPVALEVAEASGDGRAVSAFERATIRGAITRGQRSVANAAKAAGGKVLATYQDAYNGIRVRIAASKVEALARIRGVVAVHALAAQEITNARSVPFIGAPSVWEDLGFSGAGIKIGVIDTGIDYFHANFGGSGDPDDYADDDHTTVEAGTFPTAKVRGGYDFAGDNYDADGELGSPIPSPDLDPVDCNGHGSHVAGTAAGKGVTAAGASYNGPYNRSIPFSTFKVAPGVAPRAWLYAYKVFGCDGSTDLTVDAINRAVRDGVDVINMSLGSVLGRPDDPSAVATNNAVAAGVVVVTSAGNSGGSPYLVGSPGIASRAISTAAEETTASFRIATISGTTIDDITAINANEHPLSSPITGPLRVLTDSSADGIALGCEAADYAAVQDGDIVVTQRGTCARVDRAILGQEAGAAAVIMVNTSPTLPPLEGPIPGVTIPFLGVSSEDGPELLGANGDTVTITDAGTLANPNYRQMADFTSGGPRETDSALKPDITAPGVSIMSTGVGLGTGGVRISGTSMASPHVAGVAALVLDAHPTWTPTLVKAAIMNTATVSTTKLAGYDPLLSGSGLVWPRRAAAASVFAYTGTASASLSYGYAPRNGAYAATKTIFLRNTGSTAVTYRLSRTFTGSSRGAAVTISPSTVTIPAQSARSVSVTLRLSASAVRALPGADVFSDGSIVLAVRGVITATPTAPSTSRGVFSLRVPFLLVPRGVSNVTVASQTGFTGTDPKTKSITFANYGVHAGFLDVYALGELDQLEGQGVTDTRAVGVQILPGAAGGLPATDRVLLFDVNFWSRWTAPSDLDIEICINTDSDAACERTLVAVDSGAVLAGSFNGLPATFTVNQAGDEILDAWPVVAPMNGSSYILIAAASSLGLTAADGEFSWDTTVFSVHGSPSDLVTGTGLIDAYDPALSQGDFEPIAGRNLTTGAPGTRTLSFTADMGLLEDQRLKGWMIVTNDDPNGSAQAILASAPPLP